MSENTIYCKKQAEKQFVSGFNQNSSSTFHRDNFNFYKRKNYSDEMSLKHVYKDIKNFFMLILKILKDNKSSTKWLEFDGFF